MSRKSLIDRPDVVCRSKFEKVRHTLFTYLSTSNGLLGFWGMGFCGLALLPSNSLRPGPRSLYTTVLPAEYFEIIAREGGESFIQHNVRLTLNVIYMVKGYIIIVINNSKSASLGP